MKRLNIFLAVLAVVMVLFGSLWLRNLRQNDRNRRAGRAAAAGLNAQFFANPRFRGVRVRGYEGTAGIFTVDGRFVVTGMVLTTNDWYTVREIVAALRPPGKLVYKVAIQGNRH